jgi:hypothetical protein
MGFAIYVVIQLAVLGWAIHILRNWHEIRERYKDYRDSLGERVLIILLIPVMSLGFASLRGFPPKGDQLWHMLAISAVMYVAMAARWIRQSRIGKATSEAAQPVRAKEQEFWYKAADGSRCGPHPQARLMALLRMGAISSKTPVSEVQSPDEWKLMSDRFTLPDGE